MKALLRNKWAKGLAVIAGMLAAAWAAAAAWDTYKVMKMTGTMQTVCFGRMLIDLPHEAKFELFGAWIDGFDIDAYAETPEEFAKRVAAREAEIRAKPDRLGGSKNVEEARDVRTDSGLEGKIFVHSRNVSEGQSSDGLTIEHYHYEGVDLEAHVHGHGISIDVSAKDYDPDRQGNLVKLVSQLVANPDNRIPSEPGFCFDRAYVRDPLTTKQGERATLSAMLPSHRDIDIRFETITGITPREQGLLARNAAAHARAPLAINERFTNLRAAPRTIGGLPGDELVERVIEENFAFVYGFEWEAYGNPDDVLVPYLTLRMATGRSEDGPVSSSLSEPAALVLWDRIASSIRVRPTAVRQAEAAGPPVAPLGTLALAGDACPWSGWWTCGDGGAGAAAAGGWRQYFRQGERLPQALLLERRRWWQKMRGWQSSHASAARTAWTLVDRRSRQRIAPAVPLARATVAAPTAPGADGAAPQAPLGAQAASGTACPASGWWHCGDPRAVDGARWFSQGSVLPPATFVLPANAAGRARSRPETIRRRTVWQLVRLAPMADPGSSSNNSDT